MEKWSVDCASQGASRLKERRKLALALDNIKTCTRQKHRTKFLGVVKSHVTGAADKTP